MHPGLFELSTIEIRRYPQTLVPLSYQIRYPDNVMQYITFTIVNAKIPGSYLYGKYIEAKVCAEVIGQKTSYLWIHVRFSLQADFANCTIN